MQHKNQFRLQPVLNYTANVVDSLELEFAQLKVAHRQQVEILQTLEDAKQLQLDQLQMQQCGLLDCDSIQLHQQYLRMLDQQIGRQRAAVQKAAEQENIKREELVETMKNQRTLEKLRENHVAAQQLDLSRREARVVDDIVINRYGRER